MFRIRQKIGWSTSVLQLVRAYLTAETQSAQRQHRVLLHSLRSLCELSASAVKWHLRLDSLIFLRLFPMLLVLAATVLARPTARQTQADVVISNRAEATYSDGDGNKYDTVSPTVTIIVRAVS